MWLKRLGIALVVLAALAACAEAPETSSDAKADAKHRGFSAEEPRKVPGVAWAVNVLFGGIGCEGTLNYDADGSVVLESEGVRVEDPDVDELYNDNRFVSCFTKN